jgi:hypothetical protein
MGGWWLVVDNIIGNKIGFDVFNSLLVIYNDFMDGKVL